MMWKSPLIDDGSVKVGWFVYDSPGLQVARLADARR